MPKENQHNSGVVNSGVVNNDGIVKPDASLKRKRIAIGSLASIACLLAASAVLGIWPGRNGGQGNDGTHSAAFVGSDTPATKLVTDTKTTVTTVKPASSKPVSGKPGTKKPAPANSGAAAGATQDSQSSDASSSETATTSTSEASTSETATDSGGATTQESPGTASAPQPKTNEAKKSVRVAARSVSASKGNAPRIAQAPRRAAQNGGARAANVVAASDWPQYRGPNRDGISPERGWLGTWSADGPKVLWKAAVGTGFSSISVSKGRVYTMGNTADQDTVYCLDANNGKVLWRHTYASENRPNNYEGGPNATPTVDGGMVYTYSRLGQLYCLDANSGKVVWSKTAAEFGGRVPTWGYSCSPLVEGNLAIVEFGGPGAALVAFNKRTGAVVWKTGNDSAGYSSPVIFDYKGAPYVASFNASGLVVYNVRDGKELWRYPWKTSYDVNAATPIAMGDKFFISSGYNTGAALLQITKNEPLLWKNKNMRNQYNASVLLNGHIYGFDETELKCLDAGTGAVRWSRGGMGKGSLLAAEGKLVILSERGELVIAQASPARFTELARAQILGGKCWTAPALANGRVYARNADGDFVCVDVRGKG